MLLLLHMFWLWCTNITVRSFRNFVRDNTQCVHVRPLTCTPSCLPFFFLCSTRLQVGQSCRDCRRDDATILPTDQLVAKSADPYHIGCAIKYRRELEDTVNCDDDARLESSSPEKLARSSLEHESKKPRQQLAVVVAIDFFS